MTVLTSLATRAFGNMTLEQKRAMVSMVLTKRVQHDTQKPSNGLLNLAHAKVLEAFGLDRRLSRGTDQYAYDKKGRKYLDFSINNHRLPESVSTYSLCKSEELFVRMRELRSKHSYSISDIKANGTTIDIALRPFNGHDGSAIMAYCCLNNYLGVLFSSFLFNVHRIVSTPMSGEFQGLKLQVPHTASSSDIAHVLDAIESFCDAVDRRDAFQIIQHLVSPTARPKRDGRSYSRGIGGQIADVYPARTEQPIGKYAFVIHLTTEQDYLNTDPSFEQFSGEEFERWREWTKALGAGVVHRVADFVSPAGHSAAGWIIALPMLPRDMLELGRKRMLAHLDDALQVARERGASVLGLGGFTSIVSGGGNDVTGKGMAITSGNTMTTVTAVAGIEDVAARVGLDLAKARTAVVGASGAIGRLAALMLANRVGSLTLVGNPANPNASRTMRGVAGEIYRTLLSKHEVDEGDLARSVRDTVSTNFAGLSSVASGQSWQALLASDDDADHVRLAETVDALLRKTGSDLPIRLSVDPDTALLDADIVLVATNSDSALIQAHHLKAGAIVCDVARPPNVADDVMRSKDVLVFDGGMVQLPQPVVLSPLQGLSPGVAWGCLAETILLALEGEVSDHSIGQKLTLAEAEHIAGLARKHGFHPASTQWYGKELTEMDFARIAGTLAVREHREQPLEDSTAPQAA